MNLALLIETAQAMLANGKGLLAMGESTDTCNRRFDSANIVQTVEMRRTYQCLRRVVPAAVPGIMFLSGGSLAKRPAPDPMPYMSDTTFPGHCRSHSPEPYNIRH